MKKLSLSLVVFLGSAAYVFSQYMGGSSALATNATVPVQTPAAQTAPAQTTTQTVSAQTTQTSNSSAPVSTPPPTQTPAPAPKPKGQYIDGTYTGSQADAYYGTVQVQATISGGKLANVQFLQYPNTHSTSVFINQQAMPYLVQEAIQAQSANVSGVSGATDTSQAFVQSLGDALSQAKS